MAVPKKRKSHSRTRMHIANLGLKKINVVVDSTTGAYKLPHHVSLEDGYYNGREVISARIVEEAEENE